MKPQLFNSFLRVRRAFSLVEVVVAVGIFAIAIAATIGLVATVTQSVTEVSEADDASRVATRLQTGLQEELARWQRSVANGGENLSSQAAFNRLGTYLDGGSGPQGALYASRDGSKIAPANAPIWTSDSEKFFAISLSRLNDITPNNLGAVLAFTINLSWPAYLPDGTRASGAQQGSLIIPAAVTR